MKLMHSEWQDRVKHWVRTLRDDFMNRWGKFDGKLFEPWIIYLRKKHYRGTLRRQNQVLYGGKPGNTVGLKAL